MLPAHSLIAQFELSQDTSGFTTPYIDLHRFLLYTVYIYTLPMPLLLHVLSLLCSYPTQHTVISFYAQS
jgi:hypothetical protein